MNIKQDCRTERISFLLQISSQGHVSYHFPRDPTPALVILRRLPSLIPLQLINISTCWPRYKFSNVDLGCFWFSFFGSVQPYYLPPSQSLFARIKYRRFLHCSGQKHFFLFKTSNSKKTGLQIMYFKRKEKKKRAINSYFFKITDRLLWQMKPHPVLLKLPRVTSYQANEKKSFMSFLDASMSLYTKCRAVYISSTIFFMYYLIKCLEHG